MQSGSLVNFTKASFKEFSQAYGVVIGNFVTIATLRAPLLISVVCHYSAFGTDQ